MGHAGRTPVPVVGTRPNVLPASVYPSLPKSFVCPTALLCGADGCLVALSGGVVGVVRHSDRQRSPANNVGYPHPQHLGPVSAPSDVLLASCTNAGCLMLLRQSARDVADTGTDIAWDTTRDKECIGVVRATLVSVCNTSVRSKVCVPHKKPKAGSPMGWQNHRCSMFVELHFADHCGRRRHALSRFDVTPWPPSHAAGYHALLCQP